MSLTIWTRSVIFKVFIYLLLFVQNIDHQFIYFIIVWLDLSISYWEIYLGHSSPIWRYSGTKRKLNKIDSSNSNFRHSSESFEVTLLLLGPYLKWHFCYLVVVSHHSTCFKLIDNKSDSLIDKTRLLYWLFWSVIGLCFSSELFWNRKKRRYALNTVQKAINEAIYQAACVNKNSF